MKKLYLKQSYKKIQMRRAAKMLRRRLISNEKRKNKARNVYGLNTNERKNHQLVESTYRLKAPICLKFFENTDEVLEYVEKILLYIRKGRNVLTDFSHVKEVGNDALVLIAAAIHDYPFKKNVVVTGNFPKDPVLRNIFEESGMFKKPGKKTSNYVLTRNDKKADGKIADHLITRVTKVVFGESGTCPGVYRALMESMANTCYHARPGKTAYENWWVTVYHNKKENLVSFAFIDLGVGILKSRNMRLFHEQLASTLGITSNTELLKKILQGKKKSSTGLSYRGKGLPAIAQGLERNYYSNLKIISNDVKADVENDNFEKLRTEFRGTFLYWELKSNNRWVPSK